ncbi:MAG: THUMP domain-containing class I SAM-dependent methyltransferase [Ktedonobacterales bacterium]
MATQSYYAMTMPGLETIAFSEIKTRMPDAELLKFARGIVLFRTSAPVGELQRLRTTEDVFVLLRHVTHLGPGRDAVRVLHSATLQSDVARALALWRVARHSTTPRTWRVVSQKRGEHEFRRVDAGEAVADALRRALPRSLRWMEDNTDLEFWLWISGSEALIGLRLSDATMRHRRYQQEHLPASLRPTVAAAMGWLSMPTSTDRVLDSLCGTATLLIERAKLLGYEQLIGGDIRPEEVAVARRNALAAGVNISLQVWDARALPLDAASVTRIITNLPFGKQIGTPEANEHLYPALVKEFGRVLAAGGVLVALTSQDRHFQHVLGEQGWHTSKKMVVVVLGQPATIFVAQRH